MRQIRYLQMKSTPGLVASNLAARSRPQLFTFPALWAWLNVRMERPRGALSVGVADGRPGETPTLGGRGLAPVYR
jgi:hypothetical protein